MSRQIVVIPDIHCPFEDRPVVRAVIRAIGDLQPDEVVQIGDLLDFPQPSRWNKDTRAEFEGSIFEDVEKVKQRFLGPLRDVYSGPVLIHEGNHDERPRVYLEKYAPALAGSGQFNFEKLCDFDGFGVTLAPEFYKVAPGWITTHGHRGGIRLSQIAGSTALNAARRMDTSVIMGHTHRLGQSHFTSGYGGAEKVLTGIEAGHLTNQKLHEYLKGATANWQQGLVVLTVESNYVQAEVVRINKGRFAIGGDVWNV